MLLNCNLSQYQHTVVSFFSVFVILIRGSSDEFHLILLVRFWKPVVISVAQLRTQEANSKTLFHFTPFWNKLGGLKFPLTTKKLLPL